jgi:outer membrane protein OmpA-like peptidoglycan-associated protein
VIYNINDQWGVRADVRGAFASASSKGTVNSTIDVGIRYVIGANVPPSYSVSGGAKDSDADGLTDDEERRIGTDPYKADTDGDGLSDYQEVKEYKTDPLNPDTDYDGLKDGPEVFTHNTNPRERDTDKGGVADGHEVIEDHTNPNDPSDDLQLFELYIQFEYDQAIIKPEYFEKLDVIGKVLQRDPGATARIEGHADRMKKSSKEHNDKLSERRAKACLDYLADKCAIGRDRMIAVGYGFSRPKAANDPVNGNPVNRRVEVYIKKSGQAKAEPITGTPQAVTPDTAVPANK